MKSIYLLGIWQETGEKGTCFGTEGSIIVQTDLLSKV